MANQLSKQLPQKIDEVTTLTNVITIEQSLTYKYNLNIHKKDLPVNAFMNEMKSNLHQNLCSRKVLMQMLDIGVQFIYVYVDSDGKYIGEIYINKKVCEKRIENGE